MSGHALLSPSSSGRWLACTPSAVLESKFPDSTSEAAEEGTLAHLLSDMMMKQRLKPISPELYQRILAKQVTTNPMYNAAMQQHCDDYVSSFFAATHRGSFIRSERKVRMSRWVPEADGTMDGTIITGGLLDIWDLKYGQGVPVNAVGNTQLRLYALGVLEEYGEIFDIDTIRMNIYQPRNPIGHTFEILTKADLLTWAENYLKPRAELAFKGLGEKQAGDHCRFCKVKPRCNTLAAYVKEQSKRDFSDPHLLSDTEVLEMYEGISIISMYTKSVHEYVFAQALSGKQWPGYKMVHGRSDRVFKDIKATENDLLEMGYEDIYEPQKLFGIGKLETALGKKIFNKIVAPKLKKPPGAPTFVPETDPREKYNSVKNDFKN